MGHPALLPKLTWHRRLAEPLEKVRIARGLSRLEIIAHELDADRVPAGPLLASVARDFRVALIPAPSAVPSFRVVDGLVLLHADAVRRATILSWGARLESLAGRQVNLGKVPAILRDDPCSGTPFMVIYAPGEIVVRGRGFDREEDEGSPVLFGSPPVLASGLPAGVEDLLDGDVEVKIAIPTSAP